MMRPATPLAILFFVAFALLLLSSLSAPVIKAVPIASHNGYTFGVWGFCEGKSCSKIGIGYNMNNLHGISSNDFSLPSGTRNSLSPILVIHPVAAFLALVCTILAIAAHFHSPAHSPRFLLGLFILTIPTLICSLLAFVVDILIFIPHLSWGGWIVVAATVIIAIAGLVTCGMRRSLVSRKARRKRIQENAEMNGQNYFDTMGQKQQGLTNMVAVSSEESDFPRAESPPPLTAESTAPLNGKSGSSFGTYASTPSTEDKQSLRMNNEPPGMGGAPAYGAPRPRNNSIPRQVDQFGNPAVPMMVMGRPSMESNRSNGSNRNDPRFYVGAGGRGGYPQNQRGGYPPRGGPMVRGGPMRGGYRGRGGPNMGPRPQGGQPPPSYGAQDAYAQSNYEQGQREISPAYGPDRRGMSPAGAGRQIVPQEVVIGQAMEMDAHTGVPSPALSPVYATASDEYNQPRQLWSGRPAPDRNGNRALSPIEASPIDSMSKYSQTRIAPMSTALPRGNAHARSASSSYYEDVEPRFAPEEPLAQAPPATAVTASSHAIPSLLRPNNPNTRGVPQGFDQQAPPIPFDMRQESQESLQEGQRSPATSDTSHFTSVSQRGVNPRWPGLAQQQSMARGAPPPSNLQFQHPRVTDVVLNANPDFMIPGVGPRARGGGPPRGPGRQSPGISGGLGQTSRYPIA